MHDNEKTIAMINSPKPINLTKLDQIYGSEFHRHQLQSFCWCLIYYFYTKGTKLFTLVLSVSRNQTNSWGEAEYHCRWKQSKGTGGRVLVRSSGWGERKGTRRSRQRKSNFRCNSSDSDKPRMVIRKTASARFFVERETPIFSKQQEPPTKQCHEIQK